MNTKIYQVKRFFYGLVVRFIYLYRSLKGINKHYLGEVVIYNNEPCRLINGVYTNRWKIMPITPENLALNHRVTMKVNPKEFKRSYSFNRFFGAFKSTYMFWMNYWFKIDVGKKLHPEIYKSAELKALAN